jgi:hypothetical protein
MVPQIDTNDIASIFEEHRIVRNLSSFQNIADVSFFFVSIHFMENLYFSRSLVVFMEKKNVVFNSEMLSLVEHRKHDLK